MKSLIDMSKYYLNHAYHYVLQTYILCYVITYEDTYTVNLNLSNDIHSDEYSNVDNITLVPL